MLSMMQNHYFPRVSDDSSHVETPTRLKPRSKHRSIVIGGTVIRAEAEKVMARLVSTRQLK
eukprot:6204959-Pleurochrysis_carterae.AAC.3